MTTEGLVLTFTVHPADFMDCDGVKLLLPHEHQQDTRTRFPRLCHVWLDAGYNGKGKGMNWVEQATGWRFETVKAIHRSKRYWVPNDIPPVQIYWSQYLPTPEIHIIPRRRAVERTFAWLPHNRRLSKDL
jgi:putative transposase